MGERKVLNKYYPQDFDPAKIPKRKQPQNQQMKTRMMLPMSIRCGTCGAYISRGTKFNARKEDSAGDKYLGIQIYRFYIKCSRCSAEITFKTDPRNSDYTVESGASRNFEPWREGDEAVDTEKRRRDAEEMGDAMRALENRAKDSKRDMDRLADLEEVRSIKARHAGVSLDQILLLKHSDHPHIKEEKSVAELDEDDEELVKSTFGKPRGFVKRIQDDDDEDEEFFGVPGQSVGATASIGASSESVLNPTDVLTRSKDPGNNANKEGRNKTVASKMPNFIAKPKPGGANPNKKQKTESGAVQDNGSAPVAEEQSGASEDKTNVLQSICQYDSDESDDLKARLLGTRSCVLDL